MRRGVAAAIVVAFAGLLSIGTASFAAADDGVPVVEPTVSPTPTPTMTPTPDTPTPTPSATAAFSGPVTDVHWVLLTTTSVELDWSAPADGHANEHYLVVAHLSDGADRSLSTTKTHVAFANVVPGSTIVPDVTAADRAASLGADRWGAWTQPAVAPSAPRAVTLAAAAEGAALVAAWSTPLTDGGADIASYTVRLYDATGLLVTQQTIDADIHTASFDGLTPGADYSSGVTANTSASAGPEALSGDAIVPTADAAGSTATKLPTTPNIGGQGAQAVAASPSAAAVGSVGHLSPVLPLVLSVAAVLLAAAAGILFLLQRRSLRQ